MNAYQFDHAGLYVGITEADESPLEPDVYLVPARCTLAAPPADVPADKWPRWNGRGWDLVTRVQQHQPDPVDKLRAFLDGNPDVAALLQTRQSGYNT